MENGIVSSAKQKYKILGITGVLVLMLAVGFIAQSITSLGTQSAPVAQTQDLERSELAADTSVAYSSGGAPRPVDDRKRATRIDLRFEVPDIGDAQRRITERTEILGGYVHQESMNRDLTDSGNISVRVPEENTTELIDSVQESNWDLESRNRNTDDLTERYTELELELENKRQELDKLEELMNQTNSTEELIKIQERMSEIRSRVQFLENQLSDIERRTSYTRIQFNLEEPEGLSSEFEVDRAMRDSYRGIFASLNLIIVGAGYLAPFLVVGAILYYLNRFRDSDAEERSES